MSVTVTLDYEGALRTIVATSIDEALRVAFDEWGEWDAIASISTPETIALDLGREAAA